GRMSAPAPGRSSSAGEGGRRPRFGTVLGIPVPVVLIALLASALMGVQLAGALEQTTDSRTTAGSTAADAQGGTGKISAGVPVVTETTLGTEVQRLSTPARSSRSRASTRRTASGSRGSRIRS